MAIEKTQPSIEVENTTTQQEISSQLKKMAEQNIKLQHDTQEIIISGTNFEDHVVNMQVYLNELKQLGQQAPSEELKKNCIQSAISFQRFLVDKFNSPVNDKETKLVDPSIDFLAKFIKTLAIFEIRIPLNKIPRQTTNEPPLLDQQPPINSQQKTNEPPNLNSIDKLPPPPLNREDLLPPPPLNREDLLPPPLQRKELSTKSKVLQETLIKLLKSSGKKSDALLQAYSKLVDKAFEKFKKSGKKLHQNHKSRQILKEGRKRKQQEDKDLERAKKVLEKLRQVTSGDVIYIYDKKNRLLEVHTVRFVDQDNNKVFVDVYNPKSKQNKPSSTYDFDQYIRSELDHIEIEKMNLNEAIIIGADRNLGLSESIQTFESQFNSKIAAASDRGINYSNENQDRVVVMPNKNFFAVIDGIGGYNGGEIAADIIAKNIAKYPNNIQLALEFSSKEIDENTTMEQKKAGAAFLAAEITTTAEGKTVLRQYYAGDCQVIVIRKNGKIAVGLDDSFVNQLLEKEIITKDQASYDNRRNTVMSAIDIQKSKFKTHDISVQKGDRIILMTDGIADNLTVKELVKLIEKIKNPAEAIKKIDEIVSKRMENAQAIIDKTEKGFDSEYNEGRISKGEYSDGYKSKPKVDNRGIVIVDL